MWTKEKPQNPEAERYDVQAIAFEKGDIFVWTTGGKWRASKISYDSSITSPYLLARRKWVDSFYDFWWAWAWFSAGTLLWVPFLYKLVIRKNRYSLGRYHCELVVRDPDQLREYSLVGIRQNIPASIVVGL